MQRKLLGLGAPPQRRAVARAGAAAPSTPDLSFGPPLVRTAVLEGCRLIDCVQMRAAAQTRLLSTHLGRWLCPPAVLPCPADHCLRAPVIWWANLNSLVLQPLAGSWACPPATAAPAQAPGRVQRSKPRAGLASGEFRSGEAASPGTPHTPGSQLASQQRVRGSPLTPPPVVTTPQQLSRFLVRPCCSAPLPVCSAAALRGAASPRLPGRHAAPAVQRLATG